MSTRSLTKDFLRYRSQRRSQPGAFSSRERDAARQRLTADDDDDDDDLEIGGGFKNDGAGHRQWMDYRDAVENNFHEVRTTLENLRTAHAEALDPMALDKKRYQAEAEELATRLTSLLRDTDRSIKRIYVEGMLSEDPQENALRKNVQIELSQQLYNFTVEYRKEQKEHMSKKMSQEQTRSLHGSNFKVDAEQAAEDISEDMIQELATTSNLINERDQEIANIAKSVQEIAEMFRDLSGLIIEQGTVLDRIDYNLDLALERTKSGVVHLEEAEKEQKKNRAVKCIFCLTLTTTGCLIVYILRMTNKF